MIFTQMARTDGDVPEKRMPKIPRCHLSQDVALARPLREYRELIAQDQARVHNGDNFNNVNHFHVGTEQPVLETRPSTGADEANLAASLTRTLEFEHMQQRFFAIRPARSTTWQWLLESKEYQRWQNSELRHMHRGIFFMKGKPGAGKSTLMKSACRYASEVLEEVTISHFFDASGSRLQRSAEGMCRSLLCQLLTTLPPLCLKLPGVLGNSSYKLGWPLELLEELLRKAVLGLGSTQVTCYVDALDECDKAEDRELVVEFLEELSDLAAQQGVGLRIFLSSRHYPSISICTCQQLVLEDQRGHDIDIAHYIRGKLRVGDSLFAKDIQQAVQDRASGVFLWVTLVIKILNEEKARGRVNHLRSLLQSIPTNLHTLFRDILRRDTRDWQSLVSIFQWLLFARRPLTREELYIAVMTDTMTDCESLSGMDEVTTEDMERFLVDHSKGLVEIAKGESSTVRFIHDSVRDYLYQTRLENLNPDFSPPLDSECHDRLKRCCEIYVSSCSVYLADSGWKESLSGRSTDMMKLRTETRQMYPFLEYALDGMVFHADIAQSLGFPQDSYTSAFPTSLWCRLHNLLADYHNNRLGRTVSSLYIFTIKGAVHLVEVVTRGKRRAVDWDLDMSSEQHPSLLGAAMALNHNKLFNLLLRRGASPDSRTEDNRTCLSVATDRGDVTTIKNLIAAGATIYDGHSEPNAVHPHAMHTAVVRSEPEIVKILLSNFEYATRWHPCYTEAIQLASFRSDTIIFRTFLAQMDTTIEGFHRGETTLGEVLALKRLCESILETACRRCDDGIAQVLLERGVKPSAAAVAAVGKSGNSKIKQMLSSQGISVEERSTNGTLCVQAKVSDGKCAERHSPVSIGSIYIACFKSLAEMLRMLSAEGADVQNLDRTLQIPLWLACSHGAHRTVRSLLSQSRDIDLDIHSHFTALQIACLNGHDKVVHVLLSCGADVNAQNKHGYTPIYSAAAQGHENIVRMMVRKGVWRQHLNAALQAALGGGFFGIAKALLEQGARSSVQRSIGSEAHTRSVQ
jgi:ankyrin repeat protein